MVGMPLKRGRRDWYCTFTLDERGQYEKAAWKGIAPANRKALFAISGGGRSGPRRKIATEEAAIALGTLLGDFKFSAVPGYRLEPATNGLRQRPT